MGSSLPDYPLEEFEALVKEHCRALPPDSAAKISTRDLAARLRCHYEQLRRWNPRLSLIGPGTAGDVLRRHYGESLSALPLLGPSTESLLDVGSGGGFPGLVLAAARPDLRVVLAEARQRKWAFLESAARRCALSCECLNARVSAPIPGLTLPMSGSGPEEPGGQSSRESLVVTSRAVKLPQRLFERFRDGRAAVRFLLWVGPEFRPPPGWDRHREIPLGKSQRRLVDVRPSGPSRGRLDGKSLDR